MAIRFRKFQPADYVRVIRNGKAVKEGSGLTLLYNDINTSILVIPATALDAAFAFDDLITADYQSACVQGAVTYLMTSNGPGRWRILLTQEITKDEERWHSSSFVYV